MQIEVKGKIIFVSVELLMFQAKKKHSTIIIILIVITNKFKFQCAIKLEFILILHEPIPNFGNSVRSQFGLNF